MSLEEKQLAYQKELELLKNDCRSYKITIEEYLKRKENLTKKYGFEKGFEYFKN